MSEIETLTAELRLFRKYTESQFDHGRRRFKHMEEQLEESIKERGSLRKRVQTLENLATFAKGFKAGAVWITGGAIVGIGAAVVYVINHLSAGK
ncbi:MAG: hypothetical protein V3T82_08120 [Nitrospinaceae bacterium]